METWLIPASPMIFKYKEAFHEYGYIDWAQHNNYSLGDIVYLYISAPEKQIEYKCIIEKVDLTNSRATIKEKYWVDKSAFHRALENNRYIRIHLLKELSGDIFPYEYLIRHGYLKGSVRGPQRVFGDFEVFLETHSK